jgi:hypothetical protein
VDILATLTVVIGVGLAVALIGIVTWTPLLVVFGIFAAYGTLWLALVRFFHTLR